MYRYEIRALTTLPWPHGLGKTEYPELRDALKKMLREDHWTPEAHERAFHSSAPYRETVDYWLTEYGFTSSYVATIVEATRLAQGIELLGQAVDEGSWLDYLREYCEGNGIAHGLRFRGGPYLPGDYLFAPVSISDWDNSFNDGQHRTTRLRLSQRGGAGPSEILVKVTVDTAPHEPGERE